MVVTISSHSGNYQFLPFNDVDIAFNTSYRYLTRIFFPFSMQMPLALAFAFMPDRV